MELQRPEVDACDELCGSGSVALTKRSVCWHGSQRGTNERFVKDQPAVVPCLVASATPSPSPSVHVHVDAAVHLIDLAIIGPHVPEQGCWEDGVTLSRVLQPDFAAKQALVTTNVVIRDTCQSQKPEGAAGSKSWRMVFPCLVAHNWQWMSHLSLHYTVMDHQQLEQTSQMAQF